MNENVQTEPMTRALVAKLYEDARLYYDHESYETREQLLHTIQTNDCRDILSVAINRDSLARALVRAAERNDVILLQALLENGIDVNLDVEFGFTALIYASTHGHEDSVRYILQYNVDTNAQTYDGYTALMLASINGFTDLVRWLLAKHTLVDLGAADGQTALIAAVSYNHPDIVQLLLDYNADVDCVDHYGQRAVDMADTDAMRELILNHVTTNYILK